MISTKTKTIEILNKYNLSAKKKFGQNFLIDTNIVNKIVETASIDKKVGVLEIGPGIGAMTEVLALKAKKVLCFEIDKDMVEILTNEIKSENVQIINQDFLTVNIEDSLNYFDDVEKIVVVSNLPYYITTPIICKLLNYQDIINEMYFMVQKEVCDRLCAKPGCKDYGSLSCLISLKGTAKKEFIVPRNVFYPAPNVDSAIVSIHLDKNDSSANFGQNFEKFVHNIFEQKRKTLCNNILNKYDISRDKIYNVLAKLNLDNSVRSEALSVDVIKKIYLELF